MSFEITDLLGRNTLTSIPKDQQKVLERHAFGSTSAAADGPGTALEDIPESVLATVIQAHKDSRKRNASTSRLSSDGPLSKKPRVGTGNRSTSAERGEGSHGPPATPPSRAPVSSAQGISQVGVTHRSQREVSSTLPNNDSPPASSMQSSPERRVSWPPSPVREEPSSSKFPQPGSPLASPDSSRNRTASRDSKPVQVQRFAEVINYPSSMEEEDLESEPPGPTQPQPEPAAKQAETQPLESSTISRSPVKTPDVQGSTAMETPPCAQPSQSVIPGTVISKPADVKQSYHRSRRMKPILFDDSQDMNPGTLPAETSKVLLRMNSTANPCPQVSGSTDITSSSSVIPASSQQTSSNKPQSTGREGSPRPGASTQNSSTDNLSSVGDKTNGSHDVAIRVPSQKSPEAAPGPPVSAPLSLPPTPRPSQKLPDAMGPPAPAPPVSDGTSATPFETFLVVYPSYITQYSGSLALFVKACICLEYMAKRRSLHHHLWDDFIRAFSAEYIDYVQDTEKPLPASEWYNGRDDPPLFHGGIVHRANLDTVMKAYPKQIAKARKYVIQDDDSSDRRPTSTRGESSTAGRPGGEEKPSETLTSVTKPADDASAIPVSPVRNRPPPPQPDQPLPSTPSTRMLASTCEPETTASTYDNDGRENPYLSRRAAGASEPLPDVSESYAVNDRPVPTAEQVPASTTSAATPSAASATASKPSHGELATVKSTSAASTRRPLAPRSSMGSTVSTTGRNYLMSLGRPRKPNDQSKPRRYTTHG